MIEFWKWWQKWATVETTMYTSIPDVFRLEL